MCGITTKLAVLLMVCCCSGAELFKREQLVGCWRVEPATARYDSSMRPNALPPSLPKGAERFGLVLSSAGSCAISNAPSKFLWYKSPAITNCAGSWVLSSKPLPPGVSFPHPYTQSVTNGYGRLTLALDLPGERATFEFPVIWVESPSSPKRPAIIIGPREGADGYEWSVMLSRAGLTKGSSR